ncbi:MULTISPECIES: excinuclease ABC subunit UvrB [Halobacterium]|uniref:UvrABC system protein B n=4 Tax=Halobacterium salinarum TaxID=2242 RepID=UVRB_HALSA|nr:excinuclease ABC subunit UvrB [Halobacterium salinarum]Q9HMT9.1 RecName: Full=UvrABC system protein B; Short=Protein UvrB; AltName: Full=Excinuclease ABC subunit B [Halobacterium salinarum NRC-1]AAG20482.1 excision nuclease chain B [Halobacterium salinarum NRC-1]MBB6089587.1 excinuclease ABC subunit B [Halobacterium salinarum]MCF2164335.1 excinuclease ABC subunit UvrB [Halobacterium salinarum]MCF2167122.1 excinuclease ABC subunit UvrB [Halobacterium salinarum]MCF2207771.1 excinuclease ABC 
MSDASGPLQPDRPEADVPFRVEAPFDPAGDQPDAIAELVAGYEQGAQQQTLLGVTGSGKTNTVSWVVEELQQPTLVIAHNKTLAAQLYEEFRSLFPDNAVEYFVSYYNYYQPEAYVEQTDKYIEKDASINDEIDRLRHSATRSLLTRDDVIVVASVSAIYGLGDPRNYEEMSLRVERGQSIGRDQLLAKLVDLNYDRNDVDFTQGTFRVRGDTVEVYPMYGRYPVRVEFWGDEIDRMAKLDPLEGTVESEEPAVLFHPAEHYSVPDAEMEQAIERIRTDMHERVRHFERTGDMVAAQRIEERTTFDLEMMAEAGYCSGIENYSVYLSDREVGDAPYTLLDYFPDDFLTVIDESHRTVPQIKGQYEGDKSRKDSLVDNGFRLPTAYDNRPLTFAEFADKTDRTLYVSATPGDHERAQSANVVEQIVRPTHLVDPDISIADATGQVEDLMDRIDERVARDERVLVTTLTKRMAEDLTEYLEEAGVAVEYMHDETDTLERHELVRGLRLGEYDVLVGINLLREGLDIPEVSLVAILDADQQGFLRSETSLVQTMGRAARNVNGEVVLYADETTDAMQAAIDETQRRRRIQRAFNEDHGTTPTTIEKAVGDMNLPGAETDTADVAGDAPSDEQEAALLVEDLEARMEDAASNLEFELAADIRDRMRELREAFDLDGGDAPEDPGGVAPETEDW